MRSKMRSLSLVLALVMLLSTPAMALPNDTVVLGNTAFTLRSLFNNIPGVQAALDLANGKYFYNLLGQTNGFVGLFTGTPMTTEEKNSFSNITLWDKDGTNPPTSQLWSDFDTLSTGSPTATPTATTTPTATPTATPTLAPIRSAVEQISFVNYRHIKVTFNKAVDLASAKDPRNYYFEMVDGSAVWNTPSILESNQLSNLATTYFGGIDEWWDHNISSTNVNGKTVVSIYLPEDARFTNIEDLDLTTDEERTLVIVMRASKTAEPTSKTLVKDMSVNVGVRNIKDTSGRFSVHTAVQPIKILDLVKPELVGVNKVPFNNVTSVSEGTSLPIELGLFDLVRTLPSNSQEAEKISLLYSEPVFDAHDLSESAINRDANVRLLVNNNLIASTKMGNINEYLTFRMDADSDYWDSRIVTLEAEKAILRECERFNEEFAVNQNYTIQIKGIPDLAGNIEVPAEHYLTVKFHDNAVVPPVIVPPVIKNIDQVADNIFRVEFNREDVQGTLKIKNPDGEGIGLLQVPFAPSKKSANGKYYSYVAVPCVDTEPSGAIPTGVHSSEYLAYDNQDTIYRDVFVEEAVVAHPVHPLYADSMYKVGMELKNDILAPTTLGMTDIKYKGRGTVLSIPVKDVNPWVADENITPFVAPIAYQYDDLRFSNNISRNQYNNDHYLPITVSYVDANGATHKSVVTNYTLRPDASIPNTETSDNHPGFLGSISFDWNTNELLLDLSNYPELLENAKLVGNIQYKVEIPNGYFTDSPLDNELNTFEQTPEVIDLLAPSTVEYDFEFGGNFYDILYVDDARVETPERHHFRRHDNHVGLGYTSTQMTRLGKVLAKLPKPTPEQYVPQTSRELMYYDEASNSMRVEFTGTIDVRTLTNKDNYSLDGKTLTEWDALLGTNTVIEYTVNNADPNNIHQYAIFVLPRDSVKETGDCAFSVSRVAHPDGGQMFPVDVRVWVLDNARPVVITAKVTGTKQIKVEFDEQVRYSVAPSVNADSNSSARNFKVTIGGQLWTVTSAVIPEDGNNREVILNLGNIVPSTGIITVEIVKDQNENILMIDKSTLKNPLKMDVYPVTRP